MTSPACAFPEPTGPAASTFAPDLALRGEPAERYAAKVHASLLEQLLGWGPVTHEVVYDTEALKNGGHHLLEYARVKAVGEGEEFYGLDIAGERLSADAKGNIVKFVRAQDGTLIEYEPRTPQGDEKLQARRWVERDASGGLQLVESSGIAAAGPAYYTIAVVQESDDGSTRLGAVVSIPREVLVEHARRLMREGVKCSHERAAENGDRVRSLKVPLRVLVTCPPTQRPPSEAEVRFEEASPEPRARIQCADARRISFEKPPVAARSDFDVKLVVGEAAARYAANPHAELIRHLVAGGTTVTHEVKNDVKARETGNHFLEFGRTVCIRWRAGEAFYGMDAAGNELRDIPLRDAVKAQTVKTFLHRAEDGTLTEYKPGRPPSDEQRRGKLWKRANVGVGPRVGMRRVEHNVATGRAQLVEPSGIAVTKADFWTFTIGEKKSLLLGTVVSIPRAAMIDFGHSLIFGSRDLFCDGGGDGDRARGLKIPLQEVLTCAPRNLPPGRDTSVETAQSGPALALAA